MQIAIISEATLNTIPSNPVGTILRCTDFDSNITVPYVESKEIRPDRQQVPGSMGTPEATPSIKGELSSGTIDDLLAAALGSKWSPSLSGVNLAIDGTAKTCTRAAGDYVADGFQVGMSVTLAGFTSGGNNSTQAITAVTSTVLTFAGATGLVTEASAAGRTITGNILKVGAGTTPMGITMEHKDQSTTTTKYQSLVGNVVNKLTISGALKENVQWAAELATMTVGATADTSIYTSLNPANSNPVFGNMVGSLKFNNVAMTNCTKWSIEFDNSANVGRACFNAGAANATQQTVKITISADIYFNDHVQSDRYRQGTEFPLQLVLGDGVSKSLIFDSARGRITSRKAPEADGVRVETLTIVLYAPVTGSATACMVTRKP